MQDDEPYRWGPSVSEAMLRQVQEERRVAEQMRQYWKRRCLAAEERARRVSSGCVCRGLGSEEEEEQAGSDERDERE